MGSNSKKPYFPNNWEYIAAAPAEVFKPLPFEEFVEWRVHGWQIPEEHLCVIRVHNTKTGKIKERSYKQAKAANAFIKKIMQNPDNEITIADDEEITLLRAEFIPEDEDLGES